MHGRRPQSVVEKDVGFGSDYFYFNFAKLGHIYYNCTFTTLTKYRRRQDDNTVGIFKVNLVKIETEIEAERSSFSLILLSKSMN